MLEGNASTRRAKMQYGACANTGRPGEESSVRRMASERPRAVDAGFERGRARSAFFRRGGGLGGSSGLSKHVEEELFIEAREFPLEACSE